MNAFISSMAASSGSTVVSTLEEWRALVEKPIEELNAQEVTQLKAVLAVRANMKSKSAATRLTLVGEDAEILMGSATLKASCTAAEAAVVSLSCAPTVGELDAMAASACDEGSVSAAVRRARALPHSSLDCSLHSGHTPYGVRSHM